MSDPGFSKIRLTYHAPDNPLRVLKHTSQFVRRSRADDLSAAANQYGISMMTTRLAGPARSPAPIITIQVSPVATAGSASLPRSGRSRNLPRFQDSLVKICQSAVKDSQQNNSINKQEAPKKLLGMGHSIYRSLLRGAGKRLKKRGIYYGNPRTLQRMENPPDGTAGG